MSCKCQKCGNQFKVDLNIPNYLWKEIEFFLNIKKRDLLCGKCIMTVIEKISDHDYWSLIKKENRRKNK